MARIKIGQARHRKNKRILKRAEGFVGGRGKLLRTALDALTKAGTNAYRDRRARKREFRALWITRLNAALESSGLSYSRFIGNLHKAGVALNRKTLSELAIHDPDAFTKVVETAKGVK